MPKAERVKDDRGRGMNLFSAASLRPSCLPPWLVQPAQRVTPCGSAITNTRNREDASKHRATFTQAQGLLAKPHDEQLRAQSSRPNDGRASAHLEQLRRSDALERSLPVKLACALGVKSLGGLQQRLL
eukprot:5727820-Pleurochrysis_carterae.AAC.2